ncbi:MAG: hypothetical protein ACRD4S_16020 [Candidatus Acidiferrales bacterium]
MSSITTHGRATGLDNITEDTLGECCMWLAVVTNAVEEWRSGTLRRRRVAQQFLFEDHEDFYTVCAAAGLDPENLRSRLLKAGRLVEAAGPLMHPLAA